MYVEPVMSRAAAQARVGTGNWANLTALAQNRYDYLHYDDLVTWLQHNKGRRGRVVFHVDPLNPDATPTLELILGNGPNHSIILPYGHTNEHEGQIAVRQRVDFYKRFPRELDGKTEHYIFSHPDWIRRNDRLIDALNKTAHLREDRVEQLTASCVRYQFRNIHSYDSVDWTAPTPVNGFNKPTFATQLVMNLATRIWNTPRHNLVSFVSWHTQNLPASYHVLYVSSQDRMRLARQLSLARYFMSDFYSASSFDDSGSPSIEGVPVVQSFPTVEEFIERSEPGTYLGGDSLVNWLTNEESRRGLPHSAKVLSDVNVMIADDVPIRKKTMTRREAETIARSLVGSLSELTDQGVAILLRGDPAVFDPELRRNALGWTHNSGRWSRGWGRMTERARNQTIKPFDQTQALDIAYRGPHWKAQQAGAVARALRASGSKEYRELGRRIDIEIIGYAWRIRHNTMLGWIEGRVAAATHFHATDLAQRHGLHTYGVGPGLDDVRSYSKLDLVKFAAVGGLLAHVQGKDISPDTAHDLALTYVESTHLGKPHEVLDGERFHPHVMPSFDTEF